MTMPANIFQLLQDWLGGAIGADYGLTELQAQAGQASFVSRPPAVHFNPLGTVQGGYTATLFDAALGLAVYSAATADAVYVTASLEVSYLRPLTAQASPVRTAARVLRREGRQVFAEAWLRDANGQLCATASAVFTCPRGAVDS
ncbi:MAG TPA: PaaI family thioesterase [Pseudomonas sp.]|nr:PaaI family thioesterase [Pseudomonas sp.]